MVTHFEHVGTSAWRSMPSVRKRCSAAVPASPVNSIRNERYCRTNAIELSLMAFFPPMNGSDGPMKRSVTPSFVRHTEPARG